MRKDGFTLIEVLAVITLIAALSLVAIPLIINQVNKSQDNISDSTLEIINLGASTFIDENQTDYPKIMGKVYCIKIKTLLEYEYLKEPIESDKGKKTIDINVDIARVKFISDYESEISIVKTCTAN